MVALNKIDCLDEDRLEEIQALFKKNGIHTLAFSAKENRGLKQLKKLIGDLLEEQREAEATDAEENNEL